MKKSKGIAPKATAEIKKDNDESTLYICMRVCVKMCICVQKKTCSYKNKFYIETALNDCAKLPQKIVKVYKKLYSIHKGV